MRLDGPYIEVGALSGGNQQKVLLARFLAMNPMVLLLDEPTRGGGDVGAKSEICRIIARLAQEGVGILVISSDLPEIVGLCDRVLVMRERMLAGMAGRGTDYPLAQDVLMEFAAGAVAA